MGLVRKSHILELVAEPSLALSVFRLRPVSTSPMADLNKLNRMFYGRISARRDILLTQTVLDGITSIRFVVGAYRTETKHIDQAVQLLLDEGLVAIKEWEQTRSVESSC